MKKFLSLLLALTLVLSLVVVPARADGDTYSPSKAPELEVKSGQTVIATTDAVAKDTNLTFEVKTDGISFTKNGSEPVNNVTYSYEWSGAIVKDEAQGQASESVSANSTTPMTVSCTVKAKSSGTTIYTFPAITRAVTVYDLANAIDKVYFNNRPYAVSSGSATIYLGKDETLAKNTNTWQVAPKAGYVIETNSTKFETNQLKFKVGYGKSVEPVDKAISINSGTLSAPTVTITTPANSNNKVRTNQEVVFTADVTDKSSNTKYSWTIQDTANGAAVATPSKPSSSNTYKWVPTKEGTYTVTCTLYEGDVVTEKTGNLTVTVEKDNTVISKSYNSTMIPNSKQTLSFTFRDLDGKAYKDVNLNTSDVAWSFTPANTASSVAKLTQKDAKSAEFEIPANAAQNYTVKASFTYSNKPYEVVYNISTQALSATLATSVQNGGYVSLTSAYSNSYTSLAYIAQNVLQSKVNSGLTVASATIKEAPVSVATAPVIGGTISKLSNGYYTFTAATGSLTPGQLTILATAGGNQYEIKLTIPVTPIMGNNFETVTAEPVSSTTTTTSYRVYFPTTYSSYYVINKTGSTPSSWSNSMLGTPYSYASPYTLYSTDFNTNGTCTLYVVAKNGVSGNYYSGQMVVTQTNYNIQYNGVAGETVQFAQSDFNDFMDEMSKARGDVVNNRSYPYVTFDYVTFSLPTTAQGTLYYGGTAMSTSNSSGAFNTRTKVTNLDSVTFVPNSKTNAKTITLNFALYATRYSSSSTSRGTTVQYAGSVVINLVSEDIKYTVSQGDSVRFDESDFLNYLRSTKGYTSNYTIDYVTFDQSAVSAVNEGSLYTYYSGYNYGGSVKTTDKFYYSATASQNALSDVAFLASRYAKTGETVYIPFTIYARYGSTGTGTRQLTGTVAIKIGQTMNFIDVKTTDYFYNSVKWAVGKNITNGTSSTTFSPYKSCTRAEIVTFLWRAAGSPEPTITRNPFRDVNAVTHSSYYKAILWASQKGITSGTSTTAFSPDQVCTRAQIVTFLYRYAGQPSGYYSNPFKDVGATSEASYYKAILWAVGKGITTGTSATTFSPYASCNRAEAVTFLYRYTNGL